MAAHLSVEQVWRGRARITRGGGMTLSLRYLPSLSSCPAPHRRGTPPVRQALRAINESSGRSFATMNRFPDHILTGVPCDSAPSLLFVPCCSTAHAPLACRWPPSLSVPPPVLV